MTLIQSQTSGSMFISQQLVLHRAAASAQVLAMMLIKVHPGHSPSLLGSSHPSPFVRVAAAHPSVQ